MIENPGLGAIERNAAMNQARASTFPLIDDTDLTNGGTAIAIVIGSRYFLATARHVLRKSHEFRLVVGDGKRDSIGAFAARHRSEIADVALIEVDPAEARYLGDAFLPLSRIASTFDNTREHDVCVIGFPGEFMHCTHPGQVGGDQCMELFGIDAFTFCSRSIPIAGWPSTVEGRTPEQYLDIFIHFDPEDTLYNAHPTNAGDQLPKASLSRPDPRGMSGGGIWEFGEVKSEVWQARATLVGIQFAVAPDKKFMHGALMSAWLQLVKQHYPDLSDDL